MERVAQREKAEKALHRVAVVMVHGQGEQTPNVDIAELARSVWATDPAFSEGDQSLWSVPVYDADLSEQRRLVTAEIDGLKVDFYQFYWADLMQGNGFLHVWGWFLGLLKRKDETPEHLLKVRALVMAAGAAAAGFGVVFGLITAGRFLDTDVWAWGNFWAALLLSGIGLTLVLALRPSARFHAAIGGMALIAASLILGLFATDILQGKCQVVEALQVAVGPGCDGHAGGPFNVELASLVVNLHGGLAAVTLVALMIGGVALHRLNKSFLTPVMADSARLFTASPENIPNRDRIRKRGMELLEALHNSERRYDRIIVVAHSLGTVVAYNVLSQYWGNVFDLFEHSRSEAERQTVRETAERLTAAPDTGGLLAYRSAVRSYFRALNQVRSALPPEDVKWRTADFASTNVILRRQIHGDLNAPADGAAATDGYRSPWRISDFITLGSPLSYGSFLMSESPEAFVEEQRIRRFPTNPPAMVTDRPLHHAALFAATTWTNVFFRSTGLIQGDVVGGAVAPHFGAGVLDVGIDPGPSLPAFAHNEYWRTVDEPQGEGDRTHILVLRAAMNLARRGTGDPDAGDAMLQAFMDPESVQADAATAY